MDYKQDQQNAESRHQDLADLFDALLDTFYDDKDNDQHDQRVPADIDPRARSQFAEQSFDRFVCTGKTGETQEKIVKDPSRYD